MKNLNDFINEVEGGDFVKIFLSPRGDYCGYADFCDSGQVELSGFRPSGYYKNRAGKELQFNPLNHPFSYLNLERELFYIDGADSDEEAISVLGFEVIEKHTSNFPPSHKLHNP